MKPSAPRSLTVRLALLFALATLLTFTLVGSYLYYSLARQLESHDDQELLGKIQLMRHLVGKAGSAQAIRDDPHLFMDAALGHNDLLLILRSADGTPLLDTQPAAGSLPALPLSAIDQIPDLQARKNLRTSAGMPVRATALWGKIDRSGEQVQIIVAHNVSDSLIMLDSYRKQIIGAALCGALLAALLGYVLVRRGLRTTRLIAQQAHSITAQHLDRSLDVASAPYELQQLVVAFNGMLDRLHDSFQRLSQFSADLAHDLRTPINNLMVQTQVALAQPRNAEEYQGLLVSNVEEYERLARMLDNMLFLARADNAHVAATCEQLDCRRELQRIADYFEGVADDSGVRLSIAATGTVHADPMLLRRAIGNLVANAIRYTAAGQAILLEAQPQAHGTSIRIGNPGTQIAESAIPRLFDRFYRADPARSDSASSAGLGLAIVQSIMKLHGGRVELSRSADQLTVFTLYFPNPGA
ncbi:two-component system heavy metal sensor histidine kinase CusS [Collimonas sp. PA-H2]|uniref:heavy metal sensor histidine kinase n=1 Tax=Collimonas sp. PA-H2 TaxID=1881062 RepID=UPI000BF4A8EC|nr:heavy metal sensor histidine kinase [Collimonas sp. PA-H2]PFH11941.1 two-component system heavy metal sensor histidine kinase CusS [Collimonas sp. PA-H2]